MKLRQDLRSPNFDADLIAVEFVVIHYTALDLKHSLKVLCDPTRKVSCHLVISEAGEVFELVPCLDGQAARAWHAGESKLVLDNKEWVKFNDFSIGIELENSNGNVFPYPQVQMQALFDLLRSLRKTYPALNDPNRIIGHEQIAGFRGKCDPGRLFDWQKLFSEVYPGLTAPQRGAALRSWWMRALCSLLWFWPKLLLPSAKINSIFERLAR